MAAAREILSQTQDLWSAQKLAKKRIAEIESWAAQYLCEHGYDRKGLEEILVDYDDYDKDSRRALRVDVMRTLFEEEGMAVDLVLAKLVRACGDDQRKFSVFKMAWRKKADSL